MRGSTMIATLQWLGIVPSFSRPHVCNDNPYSEALFRTLKHTPVYPRLPFADREAARRWVGRFVRGYNSEHHHSAIRYLTQTSATRAQTSPSWPGSPPEYRATYLSRKDIRSRTITGELRRDGSSRGASAFARLRSQASYGWQAIRARLGRRSCAGVARTAGIAY